MHLVLSQLLNDDGRCSNIIHGIAKLIQQPQIDPF